MSSCDCSWWKYYSDPLHNSTNKHNKVSKDCMTPWCVCQMVKMSYCYSNLAFSMMIKQLLNLCCLEIGLHPWCRLYLLQPQSLLISNLMVQLSCSSNKTTCALVCILTLVFLPLTCHCFSCCGQWLEVSQPKLKLDCVLLFRSLEKGQLAL